MASINIQRLTLFACVVSVLLLAANAARIETITPSSGSVLGATRVSILGTGFDIRGRSNLVYIGSSKTGVFCDPIPNECTPTRIVCITSPHEEVGVLPLVVNSFGFNADCAVTAPAGCTFTYALAKTPQVTSIFPQYVIAPANITVVGRDFSQGDATLAALDFTLHIGDEERCALQTSISSVQFVCLVTSMRPGVLPLRLIMGASGEAIIPPALKFLTVLPSISGIVPASGSIAGGQEVTITGTSFSPDPTDNFVTIHGVPCLTKTAAPEKITCVTSRSPNGATEAPTAPAPIPRAFLMDQFLNIPGGEVYPHMIGLASYLQPDASRLIEGGSLASIPTCVNCGFRLTTQFVANETGLHVFAFTGDDGFEVWLGEDPSPVPRGQQAAQGGGTRVLDADNFNNRRIAARAMSGAINSSAIPLGAGQSYWCRIFLKQGSGPMSISGWVFPPSGRRTQMSAYFQYVPDWTPPVKVFVRDAPAVFTRACLNESTCDYQFLAAQTPTILTVSPTAAMPLQTITITGLGFDATTAAPAIQAGCNVDRCGGGGCACAEPDSCWANSPLCGWNTTGTEGCEFAAEKPPQCFQWSLNDVTIAGLPCNVTKQLSNALECTMPFVRAGYHRLVVRVAELGSADGVVFIAALPNITGHAATTGGINGGNIVSVYGSGFPSGDVGASRVTASIAGAPCSVVDAAAFAVDCIAPPGNATGAAVRASVAMDRMFFTDFVFQYDEQPVRPGTTAVDPALAMSPLSGPLSGSTVVYISLPSTLSFMANDAHVTIGNQPCVLIFAAGRRIQCATGASPVAGTYPSLLHFIDKYGQGQTVQLPAFTYMRSVLWTSTDFVSVGGQTAVSFSLDQAYPLSEMTVAFAGKPCLALSNPSSYTCVVGPQPQTYPLRPEIRKYTFVGDGNALTNPFNFLDISSGVTVDDAGVAYVPAGGFLMTKANFVRPFSITASIKATKISQLGVVANNAVMIRALVSANTQSTSGYYASAAGSNGTFILSIPGRTLNTVNAFMPGFEEAGVETSRFQLHRLDIGNEYVSYYVNNVLIYSVAETTRTVGTVGVGFSAQAVYVRSLTVSSLAQELLQVNVSGSPLFSTSDLVYTQTGIPMLTTAFVDAQTGILRVTGTSITTASRIFHDATGAITARSTVLCPSLTAVTSPITKAVSYTCAPIASAGTFNVIVVNSVGASATSLQVEIAIALRAILPARDIPAATGHRITLVGQGFSATARVSIGSSGSSFCEIVAINTSAIICDAPPMAAGSQAVTVSQRDGAQTSTAFAVTYTSAASPVTISQVSYSVVSAWTTITLTGTGFAAGAVVYVGSVPSFWTTVVSATQITTQVGYVNVLAGAQQIRVVQPSGTATIATFVQPYIDRSKIDSATVFAGSATSSTLFYGAGFTSVAFVPTATLTQKATPENWKIEDKSAAAVATADTCAFPAFGPFGRSHRISTTFTGLAAHSFVRLRLRGLAGDASDGFSAVFVDSVLYSKFESICTGADMCNGVKVCRVGTDLVVKHAASSLTVTLLTNPWTSTAYLGDLALDLLASVPYNITLGGQPVAIRSITNAAMDVELPSIAAAGPQVLLLQYGNGVDMNGCQNNACVVSVVAGPAGMDAVKATLVVAERALFRNTQPAVFAINASAGTVTMATASTTPLVGTALDMTTNDIFSVKFTFTNATSRFVIGFVSAQTGVVYGMGVQNLGVLANHGVPGYRSAGAVIGDLIEMTYNPATGIVTYAVNGLAFCSEFAPYALGTLRLYLLSNWAGGAKDLSIRGCGLESLKDRLVLFSDAFNAAPETSTPTVWLNGALFAGSFNFWQGSGHLSVAVPRGLFAVGSSVAYRVVTRRGTVTGTLTLVPAVTSVSASAGSPSGGQTITIVGGPFRTAAGGATALSVAIGATAACTVVSATTTVLTCHTQAAAANYAGTFDVRVNGTASLSITNASLDLSSLTSPVVSTTLPLFTFDPAAVTELTAVTIADGRLVLAGTNLATSMVVVTGNASAATQHLYPTTPSCSVLVDRSATTITCEMRSMPAGSYIVHVTSDAGASNQLLLDVPLVISAFAPTAIGRTGQATLTITGAGFGNEGDGALAFAVGAVGNICQTFLSRSPSRVVCATVAATFSGVLSATVGARGPVASADSISTVATNAHPSVTSIFPTSGLGNSALEITGARISASDRFFVGATPCTSPSLVSNSAGVVKISCTIDIALPAGDHIVRAVSATYGQSEDTTAVFTGLLFVSSLFPSQGSKLGGQLVTIKGLGFAKHMSVVLAGAPCRLEVAKIDYNQATCWTMPMQAAGQSDVTVTVNEPVSWVTVTSPLTYSYNVRTTAVVSGVSPAFGSAAGLQALTISGSGFGFDASAVVVLIGTSMCVVDSITDTQIQCRTTPTTPQHAPVNVFLGASGYATSTTTFSFHLQVDGISNADGSSTAPSFSVEGGAVLVLRGSGFFAVDSIDTWAAKYVSVTLGGFLPCPLLDANFTHLRCMLPPSPRVRETKPLLGAAYVLPPDNTLAIAVTVNNVSATIAAGGLSVLYRRAVTPLMTATSVAANAQITSATVITITGTGFAVTGNTVVFLTSATLPVTILSQSTTSIEFTIPAINNTFGPGLVKTTVPNVGYASLSFACPAGSFLTCSGICLRDAECTYDAWGVQTCDQLNYLVQGDTFCQSNGGTDATNLPLRTDTNTIFEVNCPLYSCEANDCNSSLFIGGHGAVISTCQPDPSGFVYDFRSTVTAIQLSAQESSVRGGARVTLHGSDFPSKVDEAVVLVGNRIACSVLSITAASGSTPASLVCELAASTTPAENLGLQLFSNGFAATCADAICGQANISFTTTATPQVSAGVNSGNGVVTLTGTFPAVQGVQDVEAWVADVPCTVTSATTTTIMCKVGAKTPVGLQKAAVRISPVGFVNFENAGARQVSVKPVIVSASPLVGSTGGGTLVTLTGIAFTATSTVAINSVPASIVSFDAPTDTIVIRTGRFATHTTAKIVVTTDATAGASSDNFVTSAANTPAFNATVEGSAITVVFSALPAPLAAASDVEVLIGRSLCADVQLVSSASVLCTVAAAATAAGTFNLTVRLTSVGNAVPQVGFAVPTVSVAAQIASVSPTAGSMGGLQRVTVVGTGFPPAAQLASVVATVRGRAAEVVSTSLTQLVLLTPSFTEEGSGPIQLTIADPASAQAVTVASAIGYQQLETLTPVVTSVAPSRGSTAGGTQLTIQGLGLSTALTVTIRGIVCTQSIREQTNTNASNGKTLYCTTGAFMPEFEPSAVTVMTALHGAALATTPVSATYQYIDLWSRWTTWGNAPPPQFGDSAVISEGQVVMIDYSPPRFHLIIVMGTLLLDPTSDITLECTYIMINYGKFIVGTPEKPFTKQATIRLYGNRLTPEIPVHGAKVIALRHGTFDMHGIPRSKTWTRITKTAPKGTTNITIHGPVDWVPGEVIVIAPTDYEITEGEYRTIVGVLPADGQASVVTLQLETPLKHLHYGERQCFGPDPNTNCIDEVAEVMLMSRNVVIEGDRNSRTIGFGGTVFLMPLGATKDMYARMSYVELRSVGQQFIVGRYPVHFHVTGSIKNSFCKGLSVHHSQNRAFSIHGISNMTYTENVAYNIEGHAFFIEDGSEKYNVIRNNCVVQVKASTSNLNTDITPACFWITNPLNYVEDNAGSGSHAYGFWISPFSPTSTGPTYSPNICPHLEQLGAFNNNVGHSNLWHGLHIFQFWLPKAIPCNPNSADVQAVLRNVVVYKNNIWGVAMGDMEVGLVGSIIMQNLTAADNGFDNKDGANYWIEKISAANQTCGLQNSLLIALSGNNPLRRRERRRGVNLPLGDNFFTENVTFVNYNGENFGFEPQAWAQRFSFCFPWGWEAVSRGLKWVNSPNRILFRFVHHGVLNDDDGTLAGVANSQVVPDTPILHDPSCTPVASSIKTLFPAIVCPSTFKIRRFGIVTSSPPQLDQIWEVEGRKEIVPAIKRGYLVTAPVHHTMNITFQTFSTPNWDQKFGGLTFVQPTERIGFVTTYLNSPDHVKVRFDSTTNPNWNVTLPTVAVNTSSTYGFHQNSSILSVVLARPTFSLFTTAFPCPDAGCTSVIKVVPWERSCVHADDSASWTNVTGLPTITSAVTVPASRHICLGFRAPPNASSHRGFDAQNVAERQCTDATRTVTYNFASLTLLGAISMTNDQCPCAGARVVINIQRFIYIRGGGLLLGNATHPITDCTITINIATMPASLTPASLEPYRLHFYGYRAVVLEFGLLDLYGARPVPIFTRLAQTSMNGSVTLVLRHAVSWRAGQVVAIAGTTRHKMYLSGLDRRDESETATILSVSTDGKILTLTAPLRFSHYGSTGATINGTRYEIGAEVAVLSRNIVISGNATDEDEAAGKPPVLNAGWKLVIGCTALNMPGCKPKNNEMSAEQPGAVHMEAVLLRGAGQASLTNGAVDIDGLMTNTTETNMTASFFRANAFWKAYNTPFFIRDTTTGGLEVSENVLFSFWNDGIRIVSSGNNITGNLAIAMVGIDPVCTDLYFKFWSCRPAAYRVQTGNTMHRNIAASSHTIGFLTNGDHCDGSWDWKGNVAHSTRDAVMLADSPAEREYNWDNVPAPSTACRVAGGVTAYWSADHGLIGWYVAGNVQIRDFVSVDNQVGSSMMTFHVGQFQAYTPTVNFTNMVYANTWNVGDEPCRDADYTAATCRQSLISNHHWCEYLNSTQEKVGNVGALETVFTSNINGIGITKGEHLFLWEEADSYATIAGQARYENVVFANWNGKETACPAGLRHVAFFPSIYSNDTFHAHYFLKVTWENSVRAGKLWAWRTYGKIPDFPTDKFTDTYYLDFNNYIHGAFWPDALNKLLLIDLDGTFTEATDGRKRSLSSSETATRTSPFSAIGWDGRAFANPGQLSAARDGCTWRAENNAYECDSRFDWVSLNIDSLADDQMTRRAGPLVLCGGDGMIEANGDPLCQDNSFIDFASGPVMKGKVQRATLDRLSRWRFNSEADKNYTLAFRSMPPSHIRLSMTNHEHLGRGSNVGAVLNLRYFGINSLCRVGVYVNGVKQFPNFGFGYPHQFNKTWPSPTDAPGAHYMNLYKDSTTANADGSFGISFNVMSFSMRPGVVIELIQEPIVQVTMQVSLTVDQFFTMKETFAAAMASVLGIPASSIHFARIVPGTTRRRRSGGSTEVSVIIDQVPVNYKLASANAPAAPSSGDDPAATTAAPAPPTNPLALLNLTAVQSSLAAIAQNASILADAMNNTLEVSGMLVQNVPLTVTRPDVSVVYGTPYVALNITESVTAQAVQGHVAAWIANGNVSGFFGLPFNATVDNGDVAVSNLFTDATNATQMGIYFLYTNDLTARYYAAMFLAEWLTNGAHGQVFVNTSWGVRDIVFHANGVVIQTPSPLTNTPSTTAPLVEAPPTTATEVPVAPTTTVAAPVATTTATPPAVAPTTTATPAPTAIPATVTSALPAIETTTSSPVATTTTTTSTNALATTTVAPAIVTTTAVPAVAATTTATPVAVTTTEAPNTTTAVPSTLQPTSLALVSLSLSAPVVVAAGQRFVVTVAAVSSASAGVKIPITAASAALIETVEIACAVCVTTAVLPTCSVASNICNATLTLQAAYTTPVSIVAITATYTSGATTIATSVAVPPVLVTPSVPATAVALERVMLASCVACEMGNTLSRGIASVSFIDGAAVNEAANEVKVAFLRTGQASVRLGPLDVASPRLVQTTVTVTPHSIACSHSVVGSTLAATLTVDDVVAVTCTGHTARTLPLAVMCDNTSSTVPCGPAPVAFAAAATWSIPAVQLGPAGSSSVHLRVAAMGALPLTAIYHATLSLFDLTLHASAVRLLVPGTSALNTNALVAAIVAKARCGSSCKVLSKVTAYVNGTVGLAILVVDAASQVPVLLAAADQTSIRCTFNDQTAASSSCPGRQSDDSSGQKTMYIAIAAGGGGFLLLFVIVGAVMRRNHVSKRGTGQKAGGAIDPAKGGGVLKMIDDEAFHALPAEHLFQEADDGDFAVDDMAPGDDLIRAYRANNRRMSIRPDDGTPHIPAMNLPLRRGHLIRPDDPELLGFAPSQRSQQQQPSRLLVHPSEHDEDLMMRPSPLRELSATTSFRRQQQQQQTKLSLSEAEALNLI